MIRHFTHRFFLFLFILSILGKLNAIGRLNYGNEKTFGSLTGSVLNNNHGPISNARVELFQKGSKVAETLTDKKGEFNFPILSAGVFEVEVNRSGEKKASIHNIPVSPGKETVLFVDITLSRDTQKVNIMFFKLDMNMQNSEVVYIDSVHVDSTVLRSK